MATEISEETLPSGDLAKKDGEEETKIIIEKSSDEDVIDSTDDVPKISNESRHSIGSCTVSNNDKTAGTSTSLGVGGGRSNRPSQSENATMAKSQSEMHVCAANSLSISQTSKNSLMTFSSSGTFYDHATSKKNADVRIKPKPAPPTNGKDITDFRQMEQGLLKLLEDFHCGKLEAFGENCTFEKMQSVREQQERLARLHFDLNAEQELCGQHTDEGIKMAKGNLSMLMENLQKLSLSIEQLQSGVATSDTEPSDEPK